MERMNTQPGPIKSLHSLESFILLQLQLSSAVGATYMGAKFAKIEFPRDYSLNSKVFFLKTVLVTHYHPVFCVSMHLSSSESIKIEDYLISQLHFVQKFW